MDGRLTNMRELLAPLRLYALDTGGLVDAELMAYAAAFYVLEEVYAEIRRQAFVQTAEGEGLLLHEKLVGLAEWPSVPLEKRRELVLYRQAVAPFDFHLKGMEASAKAAGMDAEILENYEGESLTITSRRLINNSMDIDSVKARLETMLPAHLRIEFDIGVLTWDMFDAVNTSWNDWDGQDFTWDRFDLDGHNMFN